MSKFIVGLIAVALGTIPLSAMACRGNTLIPPHGHSAEYQILLVEVTGTHLTSYEWYRAASLGIAPWPKAPNGEPVIFPTSSTPDFSVNVIVRETVHGASSPVREFDLGGCGAVVPTLKEAGLIFVAPDGSTGAIWASQPQFQSWLQELGLKDPR